MLSRFPGVGNGGGVGPRGGTFGGGTVVDRCGLRIEGGVWVEGATSGTFGGRTGGGVLTALGFCLEFDAGFCPGVCLEFGPGFCPELEPELAPDPEPAFGAVRVGAATGGGVDFGTNCGCDRASLPDPWRDGCCCCGGGVGVTCRGGGVCGGRASPRPAPGGGPAGRPASGPRCCCGGCGARLWSCGCFRFASSSFEIGSCCATALAASKAQSAEPLKRKLMAIRPDHEHCPIIDASLRATPAVTSKTIWQS
jgi:hypothetical protein